MKLFFNKVKFMIIVCAIGISSCLNSYEKDAIGIYQVEQYELIDSSLSFQLPQLVLEKDRSFLLKVGSSTYLGTWKADDSSDWTLIDFSFKSSYPTQGMLGKNTIKVLNPSTAFFCRNLKTLVFKKI